MSFGDRCKPPSRRWALRVRKHRALHHPCHRPLHHRGQDEVGLSHFVHARMHRQLFLWLALTIAFTGAVVVAIVSFLQPEYTGFRRDIERIKAFAAEQFVRVWDEPERRRALVRDVASAFQVSLRLRDSSGAVLEAAGPSCEQTQFSIPITRAGASLGRVEACINRRPFKPGLAALVLCAALICLWLASAFLSRRLVRPLSDLIRVTRAIGSGELSSRVQIHGRYRGELGILAESVNDMAARIERQINDQRELLAAVSHEIRSPLARLRVLTELLEQDGGKNSANLRKLEREITEIDDLVGKLLASSRVEFGALEMQNLDIRLLAQRALENAGEPAHKLHDETAAGSAVRADPTLIARALGNLLENAQQHGCGLEQLRIRKTDADIEFQVLDRGPGFASKALARAFEAFYRDGNGGSLGLGLALVQRIVVAHKGQVRAENRQPRGACVSFRLPASNDG